MPVWNTRPTDDKQTGLEALARARDAIGAVEVQRRDTRNAIDAGEQYFRSPDYLKSQLVLWGKLGLNPARYSDCVAAERIVSDAGLRQRITNKCVKTRGILNECD